MNLFQFNLIFTTLYLIIQDNKKQKHFINFDAFVDFSLLDDRKLYKH